MRIQDIYFECLRIKLLIMNLEVSQQVNEVYLLLFSFLFFKLNIVLPYHGELLQELDNGCEKLYMQNDIYKMFQIYIGCFFLTGLTSECYVC